MKKVDVFKSMMVLYKAYCNKHDLPYASAEEVLLEDYLTDEQEQFLSAYIEVWDVMMSQGLCEIEVNDD